MASRGAFVEEISGQWFSAEEIAALGLPGLPRSKRHVNERAAEEGWAFKVDGYGRPLARRRAGRGGGLEYHHSILPAAARAALIKRGIGEAMPSGHPVAANDEQPSSAWAWFERQTDKVKAEAQHRADILALVADFRAAGLNQSAAVAQAADDTGTGKATLWNWLGLVAGIASVDWLPALAPQRRGGGVEAQIEPVLWEYFKGDYLRPSKPTIAAVYRRTAELATERGLALPSVKTFARKVERDIDPMQRLAHRHGKEAHRRAVPAQRRTVADLHAMQLVNIDGHKFDVFVKDGDRVFRPIMVAIQDVYSRRMLSWRIGETESAVMTRLAFADLFRDFGIPAGCLLDNGRAFASKWITGGAKTRFRFKIKEEDPTGLLPALGINPHWATPYRGQSKPIERAFRDLCESIAKHPAMDGAYTGNSPMAKPENYGSRAIPFDQFKAFVANRIAAHNAQGGRRTEMAAGTRSFDDVFTESYATAPIGKATPEQLRLALLAGENRKVDKNTGAIELMGNRYWGPGLERHYGQLVTVRFDPDDLHQAIHVYDLAGRYLASPDLIQDTGFLDAEAARTHAKAVARRRRAVRELAQAEQLLSPAQVAAMLPDFPAALQLPEPSVIRPVRHRGNHAAALRVTPRPREDETALMSALGQAVNRLRVVD